MASFDTPTAVLRDEHRLILQVIDVLESLLNSGAADGEYDFDALDRCTSFFRLFADACHHGKEEDLLFPELEAKGIPREGGPIGVMLALAYTLVLLPAILSVIPLRPPRESGSQTFTDALTGLLVRIGDLSSDYPVRVLIGTTAFVGFFLYGATLVDFSHRATDWFVEGDPMRESALLLDEKLRGTMSLELVLDAPLDEPPQPPGGFGFQFESEGDVLDVFALRAAHDVLGLPELHGEGDMVDPTPDRIRLLGDVRQVVGRDQRHELGDELDLALVEVAGGDRVSSREQLERRFVQGTSLGQLAGGDEPRSDQSDEVAANAVSAFRQERLRGDIAAIAPKDLAQRVDEDRLAVGPLAMQEDDGGLDSRPGHRVATRPLDKVDQVLVAVEHLLEELLPPRALCDRVVGNRRAQGGQVARPEGA